MPGSDVCTNEEEDRPAEDTIPLINQVSWGRMKGESVTEDEIVKAINDLFAKITSSDTIVSSANNAVQKTQKGTSWSWDVKKTCSCATSGSCDTMYR